MRAVVKEIPLERMRDIEDQIMELERKIQDQILQVQEFIFESKMVRRDISNVKMRMSDYRNSQAQRGQLDAELERLELRLVDLEDNIRLARVNIRRLEEMKPKPPWNRDYAIIRRMPTTE